VQYADFDGVLRGGRGRRNRNSQRGGTGRYAKWKIYFLTADRFFSRRTASSTKDSAIS